MSQNSFGRFLAEKRRVRGLTQEEVAAVLGMTRANYSDMETGKRKDVLDPERSVKLARLLNIDMLEFVNELGYPVKVPGFADDREAAFLEGYRQLTPAQQQVLRAAVGLGSPTGLG